MSHSIIDLSQASPVGSGREHLVYQDPHDPQRLIKVLRPQAKRQGLQRPSIRRYGPLRVWHLDISEYLTALNHLGRHCEHLARPYGFCETSEGLGFIVERIAGADGGLAPMLRTVVNQLDGDQATFDVLWKAGLALFDNLHAAGVAWKGMSLNNVVVAGKKETPTLVVIDGLGETPMIPLVQMSDRVFTLQHNRQKKRFFAQLEARSPSQAI
ncbi:PhoP regulatory network protein YrbL [Yoonia maricola]|uniref:PhoP regulatory network protein YrbL n=1 Tax=Yoonia maricola TaxID=420999 RepID=A0A2M8W621_9RHOB|nr:YrbL family protein [Yoonia maricola]PJI86376.1 PhoP regulatory network protein YrbL [Yoonia maricola]